MGGGGLAKGKCVGVGGMSAGRPGSRRVAIMTIQCVRFKSAASSIYTWNPWGLDPQKQGLL